MQFLHHLQVILAQDVRNLFWKEWEIVWSIFFVSSCGFREEGCLAIYWCFEDISHLCWACIEKQTVILLLWLTQLSDFCWSMWQRLQVNWQGELFIHFHLTFILIQLCTNPKGMPNIFQVQPSKEEEREDVCCWCWKD